MWKIRGSKAPKRSYRCYPQNNMEIALQKVRETGAGIRKTAREYSIPEASLRHRLSGRVNPESTHSGPPPMFSQEEEFHFAEHLKIMSLCGYGYGRSEVVDMATEYAVCLGKRDPLQCFSESAFLAFLTR